MFVLMLHRVSSRVSGFPVASPCLWGKLQNLSVSKVSKQVVMSFCVTCVALCDIPTCLKTCRKSFCVAGAILLRRFHKMSCSFRGMRSILETPHSTVHTLPLHVTLHALHSTLYTLHFTHYTLHSTLYTPPSTFHTPHFTLHTPHSTLHTLHFTLYTLHSTLHTLHFTLHTLHSIFNTPHFTLYITLHSTLHTPHFTLHTLHSRLYTPGSTLHAPHLARHLLPYSTVYGALVW